MKVINKRANDFVFFSELELGELFEHNGQILMKVPECIYKEEGADTITNSVEVSSGCFMYHFSKNVTIKKVNGTLMIE